MTIRDLSGEKPGQAADAPIVSVKFLILPAIYLVLTGKTNVFEVGRHMSDERVIKPFEDYSHNVGQSHVPLPTPALPDAPGPFAFANPHRLANVLKTAGFTRVHLEPHEAQLTMGEATTVDKAVDFTLEIGPTSRLLAEVNPDIRSRFAKTCEPFWYGNEKTHGYSLFRKIKR